MAGHLVEKRLLQWTIAVACIVPLGGGLYGMLSGAGMLKDFGDATLNSHFRYLSGLLFGVGLGFATIVPAIEKHGDRATVLSLIVLTGGLARLYSALLDGWPARTMVFALGMEVGVVPLLWCWQRRVAKLARAEV